MTHASKEARLQFEQCPYPRVSKEAPILQSLADYYKFSAAGPFYLRDGVLREAPLRVLDAGCGTGRKTLALALANEGSRVTGIDSSAASIAVAHSLQEVHSIERVDFEVAAVESASALSGPYDYIYCDDTLYLLDDPAAGLAALKKCLAPGGIMRFTIHNVSQRRKLLLAQSALAMLGIGDAKDTMAFFSVLQDGTYIKAQTWHATIASSEEAINQNHLLRGDKAYSLGDVIEMLTDAGLAFIDLSDHWQWSLENLFDEAVPSARVPGEGPCALQARAAAAVQCTAVQRAPVRHRVLPRRRLVGGGASLWRPGEGGLHPPGAVPP